MKTNNQTRLIILEGLPGTGKSTNSMFLLSQFDRNGIKAKWFHEDSRPHPTSFFYESCLSNGEYASFLNEYPEAEAILESIKRVRKDSTSFDLLDLKWNYSKFIGTAAYEALSVYDVWNVTLDRYIELALEKWEHFVSQVNAGEILILDGSLFQFQIYTFLLENAPYSKLETFINQLSDIIASLNPVLIYFYRNDVDKTITFIEEHRGTNFLERIWERDKHLPYYKNKPNGAEGYRKFLRDYYRFANRLLQAVSFEKLPIEISEGCWGDYEAKILDHFGLEKVQAPKAQLQQGTYINHQLGLQIIVNGLEIIDPTGKQKVLVPKSNNEFYIKDLPVVLYFETPEKLILKGQPLNARWTTYGTEYLKQKE